MDYCLRQSCKHMLHICMATGYLSPLKHWCQGCVWLRSEVSTRAKFLHRLCSCEIVFRMPYSAEVDIWSQVYERERESLKVALIIYLKYLTGEFELREILFTLCRLHWRNIFGMWAENMRFLVICMHGSKAVVNCNNERWRWSCSCALFKGIWVKMRYSCSLS